ncbi:GerAB/ArcD/ProY family transporter [Falsibacillus albus]|uniref:Uncharacterized protein n=1 Tax=Falsibacillus albus TaxID=2478915 RepID=A0A3L7JUL6_9BACI|nr:endospore germination permease [Falsibacillus albus]RLQ94200.1 hypothetical protein D9X91_14110 [Falsibacillus albus]
MKTENKTISPFQLYFTIMQAQIGVGLLSLPFAVHAYAKQDSWISVIISGLTVQLFIVINFLLSKRFPTKTFSQFAPLIAGKFLGGVINLLYIVYFFAICYLITLLSVGVLKDWILAYTPNWILYFLIILTGYYLGRENIRIIARFNTFVSAFIILFVVIFSGGLTDINYRFLFPMFHTNYLNLLKGAHASLVSMIGFESLLFIFPYINGESKKIVKTTLLAAGTTTILYVFFVVITTMYFSPAEILVIPEPILYLLKSLTYQSIERLDLLFLSFWLIAMISSFVIYLYLTSKSVGKFLHKGDHKKTINYVAALLFIISFTIQRESTITVFSDLLSKASYIFIFIIPSLLLFASIIFKKKEMNTNE